MRTKTRIVSLFLAVICLLGVVAAPAMASPLYDKQVEVEGIDEETETSAKDTEETKIIIEEADADEAVDEPASGDGPKSLDEMTDEEIIEAGEKLLKDAIAEADKDDTRRDIELTGEDAELYERYQEVKKAQAVRPKKRMLLMAAAASAEIQHIYALNYGDTLYYVQAYSQTHGSVHPIGTHVHYDRNTNNAVYCANLNRHFVNATLYEVAGQWESSEMYSALSYVFDNGVKKLNGLAAGKYTTGNSSRDWYATQMVIWGILHHYGIKDAMGGDAGTDMNTTAPVAGYENVYSMMKKLYADALYFASKQSDGNSEDPYYVMENPDYKLILQGKTDVPFFITSAEAPAYTLDVKGGSKANEATVQLYKKNYTDAQQWELEPSGEAGYYFIKNVNSGKYLEVEGNASTNGEDIQQNKKDGSDTQKWRILAESDGTVQFAPKAAPNKRIDIKSGVFVNGTNIQLYASNNSKAQKFRCEPADVRVKNVSDDGKYLYSDWIDVEAKGDLESRTFSLVDAPSGATIEYEKSGDLMSRVRIRVPISSIPANGQCDFQIKVDATFNRPTISYLAINDATTQELLVAGNSTQVTTTDRLAVYTLPIYGGVKVQKRDADTKGTTAQGQASLAGAKFQIINKSGYTILSKEKEYKDGEVVMTITTDAKGYAATGKTDLQVGTYLIKEITAPTGYLGEGVIEATFEITAREEGELVDMTGADKAIRNNVIRGGVKIKKQDSDYKDDAAQGDASLAGAEYQITNQSTNPVVVGGKTYAKGQVVITIKTDAKGIAETGAKDLPYGDYEVRETVPSEGYLLNRDWKENFSIRENGKIVDLTEEPCDEEVIRGGVAIEKRDKELDKNEALGGAWLSGIEFTIINSSNLMVFLDEKSFEPDETVATIVTDEEGHASLPADTLPYGTYTIQETATNESYLLTDGEPRTFEIREDGETVTVSTDGEELNFRNQVVRNDFHLNKIADGSNARMGQVAFKLEMVTTGETHVIVTDRNGVYNSQSRDYKHSQDTNANDFVLEKYTGEDDVIPTAELNYKAGLWFGLGQKGSQAEVDDALGALPYGEYRLTELRCEANEGYKLLTITFYVEKDFTNGAIIDLGTMTDDEEPKSEIGTTALAKDTGTHETQAAKETTIIDTVTFKNLKPDMEYTMHGKLMLVNDDETTEEILYNGNPVTAEKTFTPKELDGQIEMEFTFDSSALGGKKTVVFEELRKDSVVVAAHADPKDEGQTVRITEPEPTPSPTEEPTPEPEKPTVTPTPTTTVTPSNPTTPSNQTTPSTPTTTTTGKGTTTIQAVPVKTGDNSRIGLYLILMIVAGGAGVLTAKFRKKK